MRQAKPNRAKPGSELLSYSSAAEGTVVYGQEGLVFTTVKVKPEAVVPSESDRQEAERAIQRAESACLVSKSLSTRVTVEPLIQVAPDRGQTSEA